MNNTYMKLFCLMTVLIGVVGCKQDRVLPTSEEQVNLDAELIDIITSSSEGQGLNYFVLPESNQYSLIPQDPLNPISNVKVELGKLLFHETAAALNPRLEDGMGTYSCASCHHAQGGFQANRQQGIGEGGMGFGIAGEGREPNPLYPLDSLDVQPIRTPTVMNGAYQEVMLWNGQFGATGPNEETEYAWMPGTPTGNNYFGNQGLEIQAIAGLGVHRQLIDSDVCEEMPIYEDLFDMAFPEWPEVNRYTERTAGLAIAAYERTIMSSQAPFQDWLRGDYNAMSDQEKRGAMIFFGKAECVSCHTGPALNEMEFYALGMNNLDGPGIYGESGEDTADLGRGGFTQVDEDMYKFKVPQLYNLKDSPFFGHGGNFHTIEEVVRYKNSATPQNADVPATQIAEEFHELHLTEDEIMDLVAFLENALYDNNLMRYVPVDLPSGNCFPNNDAMSIIDQGCFE